MNIAISSNVDNGAIGFEWQFLKAYRHPKAPLSPFKSVIGKAAMASMGDSPMATNTMWIGCAIVAIGDRSIFNNGDPLAMFLVDIVATGDVYKAS